MVEVEMGAGEQEMECSVVVAAEVVVMVGRALA